MAGKKSPLGQILRVLLLANLLDLVHLAVLLNRHSLASEITFYTTAQLALLNFPLTDYAQLIRDHVQHSREHRPSNQVVSGKSCPPSA